MYAKRTPSYSKKTLIICNNGKTPGLCSSILTSVRYIALCVTNKRKPISKNYTINGKTLELVKTAKYLGLNISHNLSWNHHIGTVTKKANNINAFLSRNISSCPSKIKAQCYTTLVRPIMEYACIIWDPVTQKNIRELEMVQRRAARFVTGDYRTTSSVTQMLAAL